MAYTDGFIDLENVKDEITFYTNRTDLLRSGIYERYISEFREKFPSVTGVNVVALTDYNEQMKKLMKEDNYGDILLILPSVNHPVFRNL